MKDSCIVSTEIRYFIESNITNLDDDVELKDDTNIFESGLVNSLFSMRLLCFIEDKFSISIPDEYIERENFVSIERMQQLVQKIKG
ncbi:phosphopantetheine-binding protein [Photorhabdus hindustanensis]|uniref:Acyl carrier protein n=1 Tax=Photorhabdus hindustanensis TaxID=2918802 RepID=A0A2S8Q3S7_9GAMM|nr:phosphopantetheine-binding protein [Photorhabdus hindustanensis]PQQ26816.1 acyl carrier protein [Photorhabdus hindustanensis]